MFKIVVLTLAALLIANTVSAQERYSVSVTRKGSNLYKVDGQKAWVQTRYCYEYVYGEDSVLSAFEIVFLDSGSKCDVRRILVEASVDPGKYIINVTREENDLYSTLDGIWLKTSGCLSLALSQEAVLELYGGGIGELRVVGEWSNCMVEAALTPAKL